MFAESLVESTPLLRSRSRMPALVAIATQCTLVAGLISIPVLHPEVLHIAPRKLSIIAPPPIPAPPPPPLQRPRVMPTVATPASTAQAAPSPIFVIPRGFPSSSIPAVDAPTILTGSTMGTNRSPNSIIVPGNAPNVVLKPSVKSDPVRVSRGVTAGLLIAPIQPVYPPIARVTGTQGTVVIEAIISKSGRIESAQAVSGPVILQAAALDAVRNARYHPYLLNGEPTEVETTISINFRMN